MEQPGTHDDEAPDWPPITPAGETPSPVSPAGDAEAPGFAAADADSPTAGAPSPGLPAAGPYSQTDSPRLTWETPSVETSQPVSEAGSYSLAFTVQLADETPSAPPPAENDDEPTLELPVLGRPDPDLADLHMTDLHLADRDLAGSPLADPQMASPLLAGHEPADSDLLPGLEHPELGGPQSARSGPRRLAVVAGVVALALVGFLIVRSGDTPSTPVASATSAGPAPRSSTPSPAASSATPSPVPSVDGRTQAAFDLVDGIAAVRLRTADLGAALYRITTPPGSGAQPRVVEQDGRIQLYLDHAGNAANVPGSVDIVLAQRVRWALRVGGGVDLSTIDLSGARLAAVDLAGNATRIDLTLPKPDGTLTVRMNGGVNAFTVRSAGQIPVRVRVGSGAGEVVLDGQTHSGVAAGALFTPGQWANAVNRIDLDAAAGMSALTVAAY